LRMSDACRAPMLVVLVLLPPNGDLLRPHDWVRGLVTCYGSVKNGFDSAILTKIPGMKKEERAGSSTDD
jgi:hypothetical protein